MSEKVSVGDVDLEKSSIEINKKWLTSKELKSQIKTKIEGGDYDVTIYANALKKLEGTLKSIEEVQLRMPVSVIKAYRDLADDKSISLESCLREGVVEYLKNKGIDASTGGVRTESKSTKTKSKGKKRGK
jgi:hypothetical protein